MNGRLPRIAPRLLAAAIVSLAAVVAQETKPSGLAYLTPAEINRSLRALVDKAAPKARIVSLGRSLGGEEILAVEIGRTKKDEMPADASGPKRRQWGKVAAVLVVAGLEGERVLGTAIAHDVVRRALALDDRAFDQAFETQHLYVVACVDPDGAARSLQAGPGQAERGNARVLDRDRDGKSREDTADDLDGDGLCVAMRVRDPKGDLVPDPDNPRRLRGADLAKGERGLFKLFPEGKDDDLDRSHNEDGGGGVLVNRNFPHGWAENDPESGAYPSSEPESKALLDYVLARKNIACALILGAHDNLVAVPDAAKDEGGGERRRGRPPAVKPHADDRERMLEIAKVYKELTKNETRGSGDDRGAFHHWLYFQFGIPTFACNPFEVSEDAAADKAPESAPASAPATSQPESRPAPTDDEILAAAAASIRNNGFVPWHGADHPTLGKVEIGGWRPNVRTRPDAGAAAILAARHYAFVLALVERRSELLLEDVVVEKRGEGLFHIGATVVNKGFWPTALVQGVANRVTGNVIVELSLPEETVISSMPKCRKANISENAFGVGTSSLPLRWT